MFAFIRNYIFAAKNAEITALQAQLTTAKGELADHKERVEIFKRRVKQERDIREAIVTLQKKGGLHIWEVDGTDEDIDTINMQSFHGVVAAHDEDEAIKRVAGPQSAFKFRNVKVVNVTRHYLENAPKGRGDYLTLIPDDPQRSSWKALQAH